MKPNPAIVGGALAAGGYVVWYLATRPGGSPFTLAQDLTAVLLGTRQLTSAQRAQVAIIGEEFAAAGFAWLTIGAVANAYRESALDPAASGDSGHSIGLFQLYDKGAGAGMTVTERQDPRANCRAILAVVQGPDGAPLRAARGTASNADLAALFAHHIERCAACGWSSGDSDLAVRAGLVTEIYGAAIAAAIPS